MVDDKAVPHAATDRDELEASIARVQAAAANGEPMQKVRLQLVQDGMDPHAADAIVAKVYNPAPLSRRHRVAVTGDGANGWFLGIGVIVVINVLSWFFDWPFWIY